MSEMTSIAEGFMSMWRRKEDGTPYQREALCPTCGREFRQKQVGKKFVRLMLQTAGAVEKFKELSPEGYLPVYCIPCERKDLGTGHGPPWHAYPGSQIWP